MSTATKPQHTDLEDQVYQLGHDLWRRMGDQAPSLFQKSFWQGQLLDLAMRDPAFRVDLFRFVDCLPMLATTDQVAACEMQVPHELEQQLLNQVPSKGENVVAFALLRAQPNADALK